jgi:arylsulfatase
MMNDRGEEFPGYRGDLNTECRTIAEVLRPAGYRTYAAGKWHVTPHIRPGQPQRNWPLQRGFDRYYGIVSGAASFFDPHSLARDNTLISAFADPEYQPETYYFTDAISEHAVRFLQHHEQQHAARPFFMYVTYTAAHWPMHALPEDIAKYRGKYDAGYQAIREARFRKAVELGVVDPRQTMTPLRDSWAEVEHKRWEAACMEVYAAMVDRMDQGIGRIVQTLKAQGRLENTLICFLQDNGGCAEAYGRRPGPNQVRGPRQDEPSLPPMADDELQLRMEPTQTRDGYPIRKGPRAMPGPADTYIGYGRGWATVSNTPFREYKHWVHEGGIATPLIVHWPAGIESRGELRDEPGHLIDIMATCIDVAEATYPEQATPLEGRSLVPTFAGHPLDREALYWEHEGNRAVRVGPWKAVAKGPGGAWELYDLRVDRVEANDLADEYPAKLRELVAKWEAYARRTGVLPWIWKPEYRSPL